MLPALLALPNIALGAYQTFQGIKGLNNLNKTPAPNYSVSNELQGAYNRAQNNSNEGFSGEETAAFNSNLATSNNTAYRNAVDMSGGNLASAIGRGIQAQNIGALNKFAAADASQRRSNIQYADQIASQIQSQQNLATQNNISQRNLKEQAYGGAMKSGINNMIGGLNYAGALYGLFGGSKKQGGEMAYETETDIVDLPDSEKYSNVS